MPWCTLQRFEPRNPVMVLHGYSWLLLPNDFQLTVFYIPRSIANLHYQSLALLKVRLFIPMRRIMLIITICFHSIFSHIAYICTDQYIEPISPASLRTVTGILVGMS